MMDGVVGVGSCSHEREAWNASGPEREAVRSLPGDPHTCFRQFGQQHRLVCDSPTKSRVGETDWPLLGEWSEGEIAAASGLTVLSVFF